ncbi:hypothetical protein BDK51DRAFT_41815 [Blyttiomyces helicus]|uniref:F-box domain-containing protein n=1 Tax=Blyttiomyces helicus TaxID=388810 RepID=A0A4P9WP02_9FUNG|nr:hypothetical protein BDK51DRAFT_41815 [Blyttiomyces helicus]|eukprot:RKO94025.1 hypothetical protein BDK51DRAFT_41815 [Blyttiomyces helicus]
MLDLADALTALRDLNTHLKPLISAVATRVDSDTSDHPLTHCTRLALRKRLEELNSALEFAKESLSFVEQVAASPELTSDRFTEIFAECLRWRARLQANETAHAAGSGRELPLTRQSGAGALPVEVIHLVFRWLRSAEERERTRTCLAGSRVCRKWKEAALETLWENVHLWTPKRLSRFTAQVERRSSTAYPARVRRLSVDIRFVDWETVAFIPQAPIASHLRMLRALEIRGHIVSVSFLATFFVCCPLIRSLDFYGKMEMGQWGSMDDFWGSAEGHDLLRGVGLLESLSFFAWGATIRCRPCINSRIHGATTDALKEWSGEPEGDSFVARTARYLEYYRGHRYLSDGRLMILAACCINLTKVDLRRCDKVTDLGVSTFLSLCPNVTELDLTKPVIGKATLAALNTHRPLTRLILGPGTDCTPDAILAFLQKKGDHLVAFSLDVAACYADTLFTLALPSTLPRLRQLHIPCSCPDAVASDLVARLPGLRFIVPERRTAVWSSPRMGLIVGQPPQCDVGIRRRVLGVCGFAPE